MQCASVPNLKRHQIIGGYRSGLFIHVCVSVVETV